MSKEQKKKQESNEVKFITSLALAVNDLDNDIRHLQITIVQDVETKLFKVFFDVVDPNKVTAVSKE